MTERNIIGVEQFRGRLLKDAALERIVEGEFGYSVRSGEPIARQRLKFDPTSHAA